ncbi:carbohydrate ABC transporter permease [Petrotoga sp. 9PWA.NaAc.5.4]|uniref:carbohydrate ABC transporter permease n=1 Tax=Petrotoga sp. 9PWA.NaAc.5.4 TaxID=1434328 RepID=UPI000CB4FD70|nr:sugar ABC transporter permease [Petrotoga sp. 9PWA.NaAc.5.4]PNR96731.1 sugar ABC transporter permease [Petrotoga sp. 9PWA.NaAc.5.4]
MQKWIKNRFIFSIPSLIFFIIFTFVPIVLIIILSFYSWDLLRPMKFVGFQNFKHLFVDKWFWNSLYVSFKFTLLSVPITFLLSLLLGAFLQNEDKFSKIFRAFFYWPYMIPMVAGGTMWKWLLSTDTGLINSIFIRIGLPLVSWLENPNFALFSVVLVQVWTLTGFMMMLFITGLQNIPQELHEAAIVDGANKIQLFWKITFPLLKNTNILVLILSTAYCFRDFTIVYIMTTGGPGYATTVTPLYIYQQAFSSYRIGYASAASFVFLMIVFVISVFALKAQSTESGDTI